MAVTLRHEVEVKSVGYRHRVGYQWEEVAHQGAVLSVKWREVPVGLSPGSYGQAYYATVWNHEKGEPEEVGLHLVAYDYHSYSPGSWYCWDNSAGEDATPEVQAAYQAWQDAQAEVKTRHAHEAHLRNAKELARNRVRKGSWVELSRKRCKVPYGTRGEVFWVGETRYGERVGFNGEDGETYWTALQNVSLLPGHEDWSGLCRTCGGDEHGAPTWVPANDGKGGQTVCPECRQRREDEIAAEAEASTPAPAPAVRKGSRVEVTQDAGRDAPAGTTGKVFWKGASKFGPGERVGFRGDDGATYWAALENVRAA